MLHSNVLPLDDLQGYVIIDRRNFEEGDVGVKVVSKALESRKQNRPLWSSAWQACQATILRVKEKNVQNKWKFSLHH